MSWWIWWILEYVCFMLAKSVVCASSTRWQAWEAAESRLASMAPESLSVIKMDTTDTTHCHKKIHTQVISTDLKKYSKYMIWYNNIYDNQGFQQHWRCIATRHYMNFWVDVWTQSKWHGGYVRLLEKPNAMYVSMKKLNIDESWTYTISQSRHGNDGDHRGETSSQHEYQQWHTHLIRYNPHTTSKCQTWTNKTCGNWMIGELSRVCAFLRELRSSHERLCLSTPVQFGTASDSMSLAIIYDSLSVQTNSYQTRPLETSGIKVYHVRGHLEDSQTQAKLKDLSSKWLGLPNADQRIHVKLRNRLLGKRNLSQTGQRYSVTRCMFGDWVGSWRRTISSFYARKLSVLGLDTNPGSHRGRTVYGRRVLFICDVLPCNYCSCMLLLALILALEYASSWVCVYTFYLAALELGVKELSLNKQSWCNCLGLNRSAVASCQCHCPVLVSPMQKQRICSGRSFQGIRNCQRIAVGKRMEKAERVAKAKAANAAKAKTEQQWQIIFVRVIPTIASLKNASECAAHWQGR